ncbi:MAG: TonB-dependent receptor [Fidelibacterota bacterium]|nr:MAG: TonB-dependent receptor [Candidatus Neomarinimicrobiota bacterium]
MSPPGNPLSIVPVRLAFLVTLLSASALFAGTTGKISGSVQAVETGESLVGVNVVVVGTSLGAATDASGNYFILNVPPSTYTVQASMIGYKIMSVQDVIVTTDHTSRVDFELEVSTLAGEEVTITAVKPLIQKDLTSTEASISSEQIENLPVLTLSDVLNLQAGVVEGHFRGGRSNEVSYMIDGVPINDVFNSDAAHLVENNVIQELKVISGTFNAEYGQAQSGIVDIITKHGSKDFTGSAGIQLGDYLSNHTDIFWNIDELSPLHYQDYTLFLSGPFFSRINYLVSAEQVEDEGYLYGRNVLLPVDSVAWGDGSYIPMAYNNRTSIFAKLSVTLSQRDVFSLSGSFQNRDQNRDHEIYDHRYRYNPTGMGASHEQGMIGIASWNHIFSPRSYVNLKASVNRKDFQRYVYKDTSDSRYAVDWRLRQTGNFSFYTGGTDMKHFIRSTETTLLKGDYTNQLSTRLQIQTGAEWKQHNLHLHDIVLKKNSETNYEVRVPPPNTADNQEYDRSPIDIAAYVQSKWESDDFIFNLGMRFDYFDAQDSIINDLSRPRTSTKSRSSPNYQLSPRLGIAYPITDRGVMHVSYGHFFQLPEFQFLYSNPSFTVNPEEGRAAVLDHPFGNANLNPQKTVSYEIGLQQELSNNTAVDLTVYYKDIRNLLGSEINTIATGEEHSGIDYGRYVNRDYGQVRGFTLAFERRMSGGFSANVDYTYQIARGNASDPKAILIDSKSDPPVESEKQLVPLDWDRTHALNVRFSVQPNPDLSLTLVGILGNGFPYTPEAEELRTSIENAARKPSIMTFDFFMHRSLHIGPFSASLSLKVLNLFDRLNEKDVYADTGRSTYTTEIFKPGQVEGPNTKEEFFTRPDWYEAPRRAIVGLTLSF